MTPLRSLHLLLLAVLAGSLLAAPAARAAGPEVGIADDRVLLAGGAGADQAVADWAALGVDVVRVHAMWNRIAPGVNDTSAPAGFDPTDPDSPGYNWGFLDEAIARVRAAGMRVMLTVTGPGPLWTSSNPSLHNPRYRPSPARFADFATAVAKRYGASVDRYIIWNEPNLPLWIQPQSTCSRSGCTPASPAIYRDLVRAAYPAIKAADPGAQVLIGALGPRGQTSQGTNANISPLTFLRWMGCRSTSYRAIRTGPCAGFHSAVGDGFAYHPHGVTNAPGTPFPNGNDVDLASLPRMEAVLDKLQSSSSLRATTRRFDLYLDEYGYQTNPPDRFLGVSAAAQDLWLQEAAYRAWHDPRVRNLTQYGWVDEPLGAGGAGWQSGLKYADGRAKAALAHFDTPFYLDAAHSRLWGQVRPGSGAQHVDIQRKLRGSSTYRTIATATTDGQGYWSTTLRLIRGASYRFVAAGQTSGSRTR